MRSIGIPPRWPRTLGAAAALLAATACRDDAATGPGSGAPARPPDASIAPRDPRPPVPPTPAARANEIVISRTLVRAAAARSGLPAGVASARTRQTIHVNGAALAGTAGTQLATLTRTAPATAEALLQRGLVGPIQVAARPASAVCSNAAPWVKTRQVGGTTVVLRGTGDVPYTEMSVSHDGRNVGTVRARWQRLRGSWRLVSQEATTADGRIVDTYAVARPRGHDALAEAPIPVRACAGPSAAIVPLVEDASVLGLAGMVPTFGALSSLGVTAALSVTSCEVSEEALEAPCTDLALDLAEKGILVVATALAAAAVCLAPPPVNAVLCAAAMATYAAASAAAAAAKERYDRCKASARAAAKAECCGGDATVRFPSSGALAMSAVAASAAMEEISCDDDGGGTIPPPPGGGSSGGGDGGGGGGTGGCTQYCAYTDYYDANGRYLYTDQEYCWWECAT